MRTLAVLVFALTACGGVDAAAPRDAAVPRDSASPPRDTGAIESGPTPTDAARDAPAPGDAGDPGDAGNPGVIFSEDFEDSSAGPYTAAQLDRDFLSPDWSNGIEQGRVTVVDRDGSHVLCVAYPAGGVGPAEGGAQWKLELRDRWDELYLSYRVLFTAPFQFVRGGKLPGLAGGAANSGGDRPTGYDGWSARMMWRTGGGMVQYLYHPDQPGIYGEDLPWDAGGTARTFEPGRWYVLEHRVAMNTSPAPDGPRDGVMQGWLDGTLALDRTDIRFRYDDTFAVDAMYFSTFFGGADPTWAPSEDQEICYDDFVIATAPITH